MWGDDVGAMLETRQQPTVCVVVFPCVGVCAHPVRAECGHARGAEDLPTFFECP